MNLSSSSTLLRPPATRNRSQARGFSLLEVAIALVIFVFGALAIVRIFPGALRVINVGGSRQNALNINRVTMARVQNNPPYATYDMKQNGDVSASDGGWSDGYPGDPSASPPKPPEPRAVLGSVRRGYSLPRDSNQRDAFDLSSALGSIRAVVGEQEGVDLTSATQATSTPFVLTQFPIVPATAVVIKEKAALVGATLSQAPAGNGTLDLTDARWANTGDAFIPAIGDVYYVTLRYQYIGLNSPNAQIWGVVDYPVINSGGLPTVIVSPPYQSAAATNAVVVGQVDVTCLRTLATTLPVPEGDAGRGYVDLSGVTAQISSNGSPHNLGDVKFTDQVFIDYQADWQRILQEGSADVVPDRLPITARQIVLAAPFIEEQNTTSVLTLSYAKNQNTQNVFSGIKGAWGDGNLNGDNATALPNSSGPLPKLLSLTYPNSNSPSQTVTSDLKGSRVTFDLGSSQGFTNRVSYITRDSWSQQLSVATAAYKPFISGANEPWRDYYLDANNGIIYFHASEAGKSVMVTYSYQSGSGPSATTITMRNRLLTIEDDPVQAPSALTTSGFASQLQLTDTEGNPLSGNLLSISSVRGASVTVRTAWLDGNRYTQSFLTAMRAGTGAEAMP